MIVLQTVHEGFVLQVATHKPLFILNGRRDVFTRVEWLILLVLMENAGKVYSRSDLLGRCFAEGTDSSERTVDTHIKNLRKKLQIPGWIRTVRAQGYRFNPELSVEKVEDSNLFVPDSDGSLSADGMAAQH